MPDPIPFAATTPRHRLPYLVAGQAQKEVFVNESLARLDALLHASVSGSSVSPPSTPVIGECWIVEAAASGDWTDRDADLATWDGNEWAFAAPLAGMKVWDESVASYRMYNGGWQAVPAVAGPSGGGTVDAEARSAISDLIAALQQAGIIS